MGSKWNQLQWCERGLFVLQAHGSLAVDTPKEGTRKNSSWEEEGINALCQLIGQWVIDSLSGGIDSRKEIDLWLLQKQKLFHWVWYFCVLVLWYTWANKLSIIPNNSAEHEFREENKNHVFTRVQGRQWSTDNQEWQFEKTKQNKTKQNKKHRSR